MSYNCVSPNSFNGIPSIFKEMKVSAKRDEVKRVFPSSSASCHLKVNTISPVPQPGVIKPHKVYVPSHKKDAHSNPSQNVQKLPSEQNVSQMKPSNLHSSSAIAKLSQVCSKYNKQIPSSKVENLSQNIHQDYPEQKNAQIMFSRNNNNNNTLHKESTILKASQPFIENSFHTSISEKHAPKSIDMDQMKIQATITKTPIKKINLSQYRARASLHKEEGGTEKNLPVKDDRVPSFNDSIVNNALKTLKCEAEIPVAKNESADSVQNLALVSNDSKAMSKENGFDEVGTTYKNSSLMMNQNGIENSKFPSIFKEDLCSDRKQTDAEIENSLDELVVLSSDDEYGNNSEKSDANKWSSSTHHHHHSASTKNFALSGGGTPDNLVNRDISENLSQDFVTLRCHKMWIGSYEVVPKSRIRLTKGRFTVDIPTFCDDNRVVNLILNYRGICKIAAHLEDEYPAFFLYISPSMASYLRRTLNMKDENGYYLDPLNKKESVQRISIFTEPISPELRVYIQDFWTLSSGSKGKLINYMLNISRKEANEIIVRISPGENNHNGYKSQAKQKTKSLLIYPAPPIKGGITITTDDYYCLEEEQFLNDVIIDFYLKWFISSQVSEEDRERIHTFSTFFYKRLTSKPKKARRVSPTEEEPTLTPAQERHARVQSWTKDVDIFSKDFILIPINEHSHWILAVICFPGLDGPVHARDGTPAPPMKERIRKASKKLKVKDETPFVNDAEWSDRDEAEGEDDEFESVSSDEPPMKKAKLENEFPADSEPIKQPCILIFDSFTGTSRGRIVATLRDYVSVEYNKKKQRKKEFTKETMKGMCPKVPQQMNFSDCGLFTLQFAQSFFERPLKDFRYPIPTLSDWFKQDVVACKRESIAQLIKQLMDEYKSDHGIILPSLHFNSLKESPKQECSLASVLENLNSAFIKSSNTEDDETVSRKSLPKLDTLPPKTSSRNHELNESKPVTSQKEPKKVKIKVYDQSNLAARPKTPLHFVANNHIPYGNPLKDLDSLKEPLKKTHRESLSVKDGFSVSENSAFKQISDKFSVPNNLKTKNTHLKKETKSSSSSSSNKKQSFL